MPGTFFCICLGPKQDSLTVIVEEALTHQVVKGKRKTKSARVNDAMNIFVSYLHNKAHVSSLSSWPTEWRKSHTIRKRHTCWLKAPCKASLALVYLTYSLSPTLSSGSLWHKYHCRKTQDVTIHFCIYLIQIKTSTAHQYQWEILSRPVCLLTDHGAKNGNGHVSLCRYTYPTITL